MFGTSSQGSWTSEYSSGRKERFLEGLVNGKRVKAFLDTGADASFISPQLVSKLGLTLKHHEPRTIHLPNHTSVVSPGMVEIPWVFQGETTLNKIQCWVFPGAVHDLVLGSPFLNFSETLTKSKSRLATMSRPLGLQPMGFKQQRLWGLLNNQPTLAVPDTGSDVMLVSRQYAMNVGLKVDWGYGGRLEVEYADGSTDWTSGIARDVPWTVGDTTVSCDFHVLDNLSVDVVLSNDYLFDMDVFSEHQEHLLSMDCDEDMLSFFGIRLLHRSSEGPSDDGLEDTTSPNAFGPAMIQKELAKRDEIRDSILALPEEQRDAARQAEMERQQQWEQLRRAHRARWQSATPNPTPSDASNQGKPDQRGTESNPLEPGRRTKWKDRMKLALPARYSGRGGEMTSSQETTSDAATDA
ncbi:hypothetical protein B0T16DRAFT_337399 [Cercophora newfieldiana]|uniref:Peptidase A2 domain-containing protein n=1 Tax=Cercophora newfieldiana TaxID=92897 RepID=A0AA39XT79_9PEZI|nr:hypothetical protein B0T16DRAFT_337399 [Cercophora newfieldiana]